MSSIDWGKSFAARWTNRRTKGGDPTRLGFIGTGVIASAIVSGLFRHCQDRHEIYLSPRSEERALALRRKFENVTVRSTNQHVPRQSDFILLTIIGEKEGFSPWVEALEKYCRRHTSSLPTAIDFPREPPIKTYRE